MFIKQVAVLLAVGAMLGMSGSASADTFGSGADAFDIEFVTIGDPGNLADTTGGPNPAGAVSYAYRMGKYEISEQMIDKANMLGNLGITKDTRGPDKPATNITWFEAARFVNWLNTSSGHVQAYKFAIQPGEPGYNKNAGIQLWTIGDAGYNPNNLFRNKLARYVLPSADEWYKAAYYDAANDLYYNYPTGSDAVPDGIDFVGDPDFDAVFFDGATDPEPNDITNVGLLSPYDTAGQGGNVWEWNETEDDLINDSNLPLDRIIRGGVWGGTAENLLSLARVPDRPFQERFHVGFRVASVPEPKTTYLFGLGFLGAFGLIRRRYHKINLRH